MLVDGFVDRNLFARHELGDVGALGRLPCGVLHGIVSRPVFEDAGQLFFRRAGMLLEVVEDQKIVLGKRCHLAEDGRVGSEVLVVLLAFDAK